MAVDHLSLYQLTIEQGTAFADRYARGGLKGLPQEDAAADMYEATQEICAGVGMDAYEVSNHAKPGAESRHNLIYWRYGDYVGIGPGAHGRVTLDGQRHATEAWSNPDRWLAAVDAGQAEKQLMAVDPEDQAAEYLMMGLRIREGIDVGRYTALAGEPLPADKLEELRDLGMVQGDAQRLWVTEQGRPVLNAVLRDLLVG
jgi:oxygen-independent coproporphyrinogen-3 oxidase